MMAGQLLRSEEAPVHSAEDVPKTPYFDAETSSDEEDEAPAPAPKLHPSRNTGRSPIVTTTVRQESTPTVQPTYRPAFIPPVPEASQPPKTAPQVDVSDVTVGSTVTHKAFGTGTVANIEKGLITVSFHGMEKKFQFPGAFQQGFLSKG